MRAFPLSYSSAIGRRRSLIRISMLATIALGIALIWARSFSRNDYVSFVVLRDAGERLHVREVIARSLGGGIMLAFNNGWIWPRPSPSTIAAMQTGTRWQTHEVVGNEASVAYYPMQRKFHLLGFQIAIYYDSGSGYRSIWSLSLVFPLWAVALVLVMMIAMTVQNCSIGRKGEVRSLPIA